MTSTSNDIIVACPMNNEIPQNVLNMMMNIINNPISAAINLRSEGQLLTLLGDQRREISTLHQQIQLHQGSTSTRVPDLVVELERMINNYQNLQQLLNQVTAIVESHHAVSRNIARLVPEMQRNIIVNAEILKLLIPITGAAAVALVAYTNTSPTDPTVEDNSTRSIILALAAVANAIGFAACLASLRLIDQHRNLSRVLERVGSIAASFGVLLLMALFLPLWLIWVPLLGAGFSVVSHIM